MLAVSVNRNAIGSISRFSGVEGHREKTLIVFLTTSRKIVFNTSFALQVL